MNLDLLITPNWPAPATIKAYTTLRGLEFDKSFNNWSTFQQTLQLPNKPILVAQKHTNIVLPAIEQNHHQIADATFTDQPQQICLVTTADCVPLLICNRQGSKVAAIHAGWRGLASGIIGKTIEALDLPGQELLVWLGPAISQDCYEVGRDVRDSFLTADPQSIDYFKVSSDQHWMADLYGLARLQLKKLNIQQIYGGEYCTYSDSSRFYSFRRDKIHNGHMANLIWIA